jgi:hypothetical protein
LDSNTINAPEKAFGPGSSGFLHQNIYSTFFFRSCLHRMVSFAVDNLKNLIQQGVGAFDPVNVFNIPVFDGAVIDRIGCSAPVCMDQTTGSQQGTSEVSDYHQKYIGEVVGEDLTEYGFAGSRGWFAVVVRAAPELFGPQPPGVTMMTGAVMFFFNFQEQLLNFIFIDNRKKQGNKPAAFFLV